MDKVFTWNGKALNTFGDIMAAVDGITEQAEARAFLAAYQEVTPHAAANIGYLAGYASSERAQEIYRLFGVAHPFFGTTEPTPEEAFRLGQQLGEQWKAERQG